MSNLPNNDGAWYLQKQGRVTGPFTVQQLQQLRSRGIISRFHQLSRDKASWETAEALGLFAIEEKVSEPVIVTTPIVCADESENSSKGNKKSRRLVWMAVSIMLLGLMTSAGLLSFYLLNKPTKGGFITSVTQEDKLAEAVGLVVCGYKCSSLNEMRELPLFDSGTCFAVTHDGYLITNEHVVEKVWKSLNNPLEVQAFRLKNGWEIVRPTIWVFFGKNKHVAELVYVSNDFDMAVLKINVSDAPFFRLGNGDQLQRGTRVYAVGFPGASRLELGNEEKEKKYRVDKNIKEGRLLVETFFEPRAFDYVFTDGTVSLVSNVARNTKQVNINQIQHTATINTGNSGGPLLIDTGMVVGINTYSIKPEFGANAFFSPTLPQMKKELETYVKGLKWE